MLANHSAPSLSDTQDRRMLLLLVPGPIMKHISKSVHETDACIIHLFSLGILELTDTSSAPTLRNSHTIRTSLRKKFPGQIFAKGIFKGMYDTALEEWYCSRDDMVWIRGYRHILILPYTLMDAVVCLETLHPMIARKELLRWFIFSTFHIITKFWKVTDWIIHQYYPEISESPSISLSTQVHHSRQNCKIG